MATIPADEEDPVIYDVAIIGAGPCGLAVAARLREETPSAIFTDEEQRRYHWLKKYKGQMAIKNKKTLEVSSPSHAGGPGRGPSLLVLDKAGDSWLSKWNSQFTTFDISHLRSPMFFHIDPRDRDGLLGYTYRKGREAELLQIAGCVGQERTKNQRKKDRGRAGNWREQAIDERDRQDYYTPSRRLFRDHCEYVIEEYDLRKHLVKQEAVTDVDFGYVEGVSDMERVFTLTTSKNIWFAKTVVLSVGAGGEPEIPDSCGRCAVPGACHSMHIKTFPDPSVIVKHQNRKETSVVIVGGGLTAAHLAVNAIRSSVTKVHMIVRSHLKASFWSADTDEERADQILEARGGGSITPRIHKIMKKLVCEGRLEIHTNTRIKSRRFDAQNSIWNYVYFATGIATDFRKIPLLQTLLQKHPIDGVHGLPCLTEDMAWDSDVPLFATGKLASLRLGPGAANLAGARVGAERIAWAIQDCLGDDVQEEDMDAASDKYRYGIGSRYDSLGVGEDED
ncbi:hypothetical protein ANO11243_015730 [Dothideomycetidae sp. 11243]|nr:hypothetical protein ANO11243_015730 [fungal sp. No.11243]